MFEISPRANKVMVREAIQKAYNVKVLSVNIAKTRGKLKRYGPRIVRTPDRKKAIVTLQEGNRIQIFEGA